MRDTLRDFVIAVAAVASLFAGFQAWSNGRRIAELQGALDVTAQTLTAHVNTAGLHR